VFDGPKVIPDDPRLAAQVEQWVLERLILRFVTVEFDKAAGPPSEITLARNLYAVFLKERAANSRTQLLAQSAAALPPKTRALRCEGASPAVHALENLAAAIWCRSDASRSRGRTINIRPVGLECFLFQ